MKRIGLLLFTISLACALRPAAAAGTASGSAPAPVPAPVSAPVPAPATAAVAAAETRPSDDADSLAHALDGQPALISEARPGVQPGVQPDEQQDAPQQSAPSEAEPAPVPEGKPEKQRFLPVRRRMDREINKVKYVYKGEMMMGLTASYGTLSSDDTDFMVILDNINADGTIATVKPYFGYFYRNNRCLGVRFGYTYVDATLDAGARFDLGEGNDVSFDIPYIGAKSNNYSFGIFHRTYAGLDPKGRFGLFAEVELSMASGKSEFAYESDGEIKTTYSENLQAKFSFNPGAAVYIFPNVCATLSFGLGGIQYTHVTQRDAEGNKIGSRTASKMRFRLNLAAINIGLNVHLWNKNK